MRVCILQRFCTCDQIRAVRAPHTCLCRSDPMWRGHHHAQPRSAGAADESKSVRTAPPTITDRRRPEVGASVTVRHHTSVITAATAAAIRGHRTEGDAAPGQRGLRGRPPPAAAACVHRAEAVPRLAAHGTSAFLPPFTVRRMSCVLGS